MKEGFWYFAHPYTVKDDEGRNIHSGEEANFNLCCIRAAELIKRGYLFFAPVCHSHPIHIRYPEFLKNDEYELWMTLDGEFHKRTQFTGIILAPKWETSHGCAREKQDFEKRGLEVLFYEDLVK